MNTAEENAKVWDAITAHVGHNERARQLLEAVYVELGPYFRNKDLNEETWRSVCAYFRFDDSE